MNNKKKTSFEYKKTQEILLMESLSSSELISMEQLWEIKKLYRKSVPYHNFLHALKVAESVLKLPHSSYNIIELRSLFISALFHDAWHKWIAEDLDEFRSLDMAFEGIINFEKKYDYSGIDYSIVRKSIIGTVFKNRAQNKDKYAILLADLDVSTIGMSFPEFLYFCDFPISVEFWIDIKKWKKDVGYFKFLLWVEKNVFRTEVLREIFPDYLNNIKKYIQISEENMQDLFYYWNKADMTYEDFEDYYEKNRDIFAS